MKIENEAKIVLIICNGGYGLKLKDVGYWLMDQGNNSITFNKNGETAQRVTFTYNLG
ncbi:MAG: hypothetical protein IPO33_06605 [Saprospiraceae bacterium]|nr:hypothetical protein [Candidatus Brachybacter algidus]